MSNACVDVPLKTWLLHIVLHLPPLNSVTHLYAPSSMTCGG